MGALQLLPGVCIFHTLTGTTREDATMSLPPASYAVRRNPAVRTVLRRRPTGTASVPRPCPDIATIPPPD